ncbi:MAG: DUF2029 domain-containing protein [Hyphomicrobiaceae bacterium]|nr:DUF2029 domain-containing protein [Hyphomicrobiaceae bacterium]MCC0022881.1 DUF2029 domain-containing protein [Hyphomicrobiaceae bacterium]
MRIFEIVLLVLTLGYLALFVPFALATITQGHGLQLANGNPAGGDFINLYTAGRLVAEGRTNEIYVPDAFVAAEHETISEDIGLRLWAYPPHSLFVAPLFGVLPYFASLTLWSFLGLAVLMWGSRSVGIGWPLALALALSPASLQSLYFGQTGNLATGLLLLSLSALLADTKEGGPRGGLSAAALTFKPQFGVLLPFAWGLAGRWKSVLVAVAGSAALAGLSALVFGVGPWRDYLFETMPLLTSLELDGSGAFVLMIPSLFMTLRIAGLAGEEALLWHGVFAALVFTSAIWGLWRRKPASQRIAIALIGTSLITPYLHVYDMTLPLAGMMILAETDRKSGLSSLANILLLLAIWALPHLLYDLNRSGLAVAPIVLGAAFVQALTKGPDNARPSENLNGVRD